MQTDFINLIEPTPKLHSKKCKLLSLILRIFLQFTTFITAAIAWYIYDYFIAGAILLLTFIVMGMPPQYVKTTFPKSLFRPSV